MRSVAVWLVALGGVGCGGDEVRADASVEGVADAATRDDAAVDAGPDDPLPDGSLEVRFLGVGGFLLRAGGEAVMTAPMYSNPDLGAVTIGRVASEPRIVDRFTEGLVLDDVRAMVTGHGHYDHLMDLPSVWAKTPSAMVYGNRTVAHILAAFAPDRAAGCEGTEASPIQIPRDRVVALDDPDVDRVDHRLCDGAGASAGGWEKVPGSNVRVRAFCSSHPPQFLSFHFGEGSYEEDLCEPPAAAAEWKEGSTVAFLIDFVDPDSGAPTFRVYYQDAPTEAPVGHVDPEILAEKAVDVALLCVGNYDQVADHPTAILEALDPRYVLSGHWENFFQTQDQPLVGLPAHDLELYRERAEAVLTEPAPPATLNGAAEQARHWLPAPGDVFAFEHE